MAKIRLRSQAGAASGETPTPRIPLCSCHLDLLRGLAALTVMASHLRFLIQDVGRHKALAAGFTAPLAQTSNPMHPAHQAVVLFFVLSGTLVGGGVLRDYANGRFSWKAYLTKRLSRLYTVLVPALVLGFLINCGTNQLFARLCHCAVGGLVAPSSHWDWRVLLENLCFLQTLDRTKMHSFAGNIALWSLAFEFWYYVLFPLLVGCLMASRKRRKIGYGVVCLGLGWFLWRDPLLRFPIWLLGAFVAYLPVSVPERWQRIVVCALLLQFLTCSSYLWKYPLTSLPLNDLLLGLSAAGLVWAVLQRRAKRPPNFYSTLAHHLARPSYTLYLFHFPLLTFLVALGALQLPNILVHQVSVLVIGALVYLLSYVLYFAFESKTDVVRRLVDRLSGPEGFNAITRGVKSAPARSEKLSVAGLLPDDDNHLSSINLSPG